MVLDRYLIREIFKPLIVVSFVLIVMFATFSAARFLKLVAAGLILPSSILPMVALETVIALEVLLSIALHLSVVLALGRLYTDSEMTALSACGISSLRILRVVFWVSFVVAVVVASLSLYVRPSAYERLHWLENQAVGDFDIGKVEPGRFYEMQPGKKVFFVEQLDRESSSMKGLFIQTRGESGRRIILAKEALYIERGTDGSWDLLCFDAFVYELPHDGNELLEARTQELRLILEGSGPITVEYNRNAASTVHLASSDLRSDIAELQWRLSTPITALLLGLLGFPLSRAEARQGKYSKLFLAVFVYGAYYGLTLVAKTWVAQGVVPPEVGIWWVHVLFGTVFLLMLFQPTITARLRQRFQG